MSGEDDFVNFHQMELDDRILKVRFVFQDNQEFINSIPGDITCRMVEADSYSGESDSSSA